MDAFVPKLTKREIEAGHWVLWEKAGEINGVIGEWLLGLEEEERREEKEKSRL